MLFAIEPAFADEFYFTRTRALGGVDPANGETGLFRWNDATNAQSQIGGDGIPLRHATDGRMAVDAIATNLSGALYGFAIDDTSTAGFLPWSTEVVDQCKTAQRSRLVSINATTAVITYVGTSWLSGRQITGAGFDGQGRLWVYDCVSASVLQLSPATGGIVGSSIPVGVAGLFGYDADLDFAANGTGIIGYGGLQFRAFDPDTGWVADVPTTSQNSGFDGTLVPPYLVPGVAFTNHRSARNGSPAAQACRLNISEIRGTDELGHVNDPFFANPLIAHKDVNQYNPPNVANHNGGPSDLARVGRPALPDCLYDWGDAPSSYGTLRANTGASHLIATGGPYLGVGMPDFEVDGQPGAGASSDDAANIDDEGGAVVPALPVGATVQVQVTAGNVVPGTQLQGWIDWGQNGSFAQAGDRILTDAAVVSGTNTFNVAVPATAVVGTTYARFRIANQTGLGVVGLAASGEVEDYQVEVTAGQTDLSITKDDGSATYAPGFDATYNIVVSNNGPGAVAGARVTDPLPAGISSANWTCGNATGGGVCGAPSGTGAIDTTADLPVGASVTYTLSLGIPANHTGSLTNIARVATPTDVTDTDPANNEASDTDTMEPPPTSSACAPRRVTGDTTFSLAPFAITGTVQKSAANGWNSSSPWTTLGGNYTFTWTFSQPVPANWIRFAISDVGLTAYQTTPARFGITLGAGSAATPADFSLVAGWHPTFTDMNYNASTGVLTYEPSGAIKQAGALQGNSTDTVTSITITATNIGSGDYIVNLLYVRPSCLTVEKVSDGGTGTFTIDLTNVAEANGTPVPSTTLTTTTAGTPVATALLYFSPVPGAVMTLSEDAPPGWGLTSAMCTDQNAGVTGNPTVIGTFASPTISIPADNVRPEADIRCRFNNAVLPALNLTKTTTQMAGGPFGFTLGNTTVLSPASVSTSASGTPVAVDGDAGAGTAFRVSSLGTDVTIDESSLPANWAIDSATCANGDGAPVGSLVNGRYTIPAASITMGQTYNCSFVNEPTTQLRINKLVTPTAARTGETVTYTVDVNNDGPGFGDGAVVTDPSVPGLDCTAATLTCNASGGAVCPASLDVAALRSTGLIIPTFPAGSALQFSMACTVTATGQ